MALQNLFSWEHIVTADLLSLPRCLAVSGASISAIGGRDNGPCLVIPGSTFNRIDFAIDSYHDITIGTWVSFESTPGNDRSIISVCHPLATVVGGWNEVLVGLIAQADGSLRAFKSANPHTSNTLVTTASGVVTFGPGTSQYVEMRVVIGVTGSVTIRVNEAVVGTVTGVDTTVNSQTVATFIKFENWSLNGNYRFDDTYVLNGSTVGDGWDTFMGILKIKGILANGNGDIIQWTPSIPSGINYQNVDEPAPNPTDFNDAVTVGLIDLYHLEDIAFDPIAIQVDLYMRKLDAGPSNVAHMLRTAGVDYTAPGEQTLNANYKYYRKGYTSSPAGVSWTQAIFNALQAGPKKAL